MNATTPDARDLHVWPNTLGISLVEFLWGLGMPVVMESTFLQLFIRQIGGSSLAIGLIPTFFAAGNAFFALFGAYLTSHLKRKRAAVVLAHAGAAAPLLLFGIVYLFAGPAGGILAVFFAAYACFSIGIGLMLPVWQNYLVRIFSEDRSVQALSIMMIAQSAAKLASSFLLAEMVRRYAFSPTGSSLIFIAVGVCFLVGALPFLITREPEEPAGEERKRSLAYLPMTFRSALGNRDFLWYLASDAETYALIGVISFYANYATEHCGIRPAAAAGWFVAAIYLGGVIANVLVGWMNLLRLKGKLLAAKACSLLAIVLLLLLPSLTGFLLASLLLGASRSIRSFAFAPAVKRLSGLSDATGYFAVAPLLVLPASMGIPLLAGKMLDHLAFLGGTSYRLLFAGMGLLVLASLAALLRTRFGSEAR